MSSHLASDWQGTRLGILAEQSSNNPGHLDQYIQGPLAQIEAARKALHSPSLVSNRKKFVDVCSILNPRKIQVHVEGSCAALQLGPKMHNKHRDPMILILDLK